MKARCTTAPLRPLPAAATLGTLLLLGILVTASTAPVLRAAPVRTALAEGSEDGSLRFLTALVELWRNRYEPTAEHLAVRVVPDAQVRLRLLDRGRADFATVDAGTAVRELGTRPRLTALAVLWPNLLHAVNRDGGPDELTLPLPGAVRVLESAAFLARHIAEAGRRAAAHRLTRLPADTRIETALARTAVATVLFTAPAPLEALTQAMQTDRALQLIPVSGRFIEELRLSYPWLVTEQLGRVRYPGLRRNLELPAVHQVLVGRRDLPGDTVRKVLSTVYGRRNAMALFEPLYVQTDTRMNAVLGKLMPFHPTTAARFGFTPAVP